MFVPTDSLPGWLQVFVNVNPISHLVSTFRGLVLGGPVAGPLGWTALWMLGLLVVFVPLALRAYNRKADGDSERSELTSSVLNGQRRLPQKL